MQSLGPIPDLQNPELWDRRPEFVFCLRSDAIFESKQNLHTMQCTGLTA